MVCNQKILLMVALMIGLFCYSYAVAEIVVDPFGFAVSVEEEGEAEVTLELSNDDEDDVAFNIEYELIVDEDDRQAGPRRDDLGEELRRFNLPFNRTDGMVWDGDNLWACSYGDSRYCCFDEDFEVISNFQTAGQVVGMTFDAENGVFWMGQWSTRNVFLYDREGERVGTFQMPVNCNGGYANDGEFFYWISEARNYTLHKLDRDLNVVAQVPNLLGHIGHSNRVMAIEYIREHRDGQFWVTTRQPGTCVQLDVDWDAEQANVVQEFEIRNLWAHEGLTHDGENLYTGGYGGERTGFVYDDGIREFDMLVVDPEEGIIPAEDSETVDIGIITEEYEEGVYNILISIELSEPDNEDQTLIEISAVVSVGEPVSSISGSVTDAATDEPIGDAFIELDSYIIGVNTDEEGNYIHSDLPSGEYELTFSATDYLPLTDEVELGEEDIELNIALLHAECNLSTDEIISNLQPDAETEVNFSSSNDGNGPLTYITERRLPGDANAEPWEFRDDVPAGLITEDTRIHGAVFIDDNFYVSGANDGDAAIYVMNRDQELVNQYAQLGGSRYGHKDLATDGEIIYGSGERTVYGFTTGGEEVTSFDSGISPCNNLAWDSDREILWASSTTTDIAGFDRDGNQVAEIDRRNYRVYGLAYWPNDPDGYQLYIYHKVNDVGNLMVAKFDLENDRAMDVENLEHEGGGVAQGCFITNQYDIYSWVFMGIANSGAEDRIDIWQLDARKDWMAIEPVEGVIAAGEQQEFVLTLDATGLPQALYEGEILFRHDGIGGETILPISLQVGEGGGGGPEEMVLELPDGWNMVSAYVQPDPDDIIEIMADLVEAGTLIMVKNGAGQFYNAQFNFNNIPGWVVSEGYMMKMDGADELTITGEAVPWNTAIALDAGWQIASYYPRQGIDAILALSGVVDVLLIAKDVRGRFYSPAFNFSNMGEMVPGQGYLLKMDEAAEFVYTVEDQLASQSSPFLRPTILPVHPNTGENMSLLLHSDIAEGEVGVYTNDVLVGSGVILYGMCGVAVWGDDPTTPEVDGAINSDVLEISIFDGVELRAAELENIQGETKYLTNGFYVGRVLKISTLPLEFGIVDAYPNPFNSSTNITYNLPEATQVEIALFDLAGRQIVHLMSNNKHAGQHTLTIDGNALSSGVYLMQLQANSEVSKRKLILLK